MPVMPAPMTRTSTAMSSFNAENLGAGVVSIQYELVSMCAMGCEECKPWAHLRAWRYGGKPGARCARGCCAEAPSEAKAGALVCEGGKTAAHERLGRDGLRRSSRRLRLRRTSSHRRSEERRVGEGCRSRWWRACWK